MTQPAPGYQQYRPLPPPMGMAAPPKPSGGGLTSMLAAILALVTAGLAVGGSFAPVSSFSNSFESDGETTTVGHHTGWWTFTDNGSTSPFEEESRLVGWSLVLVAVLLVLGAVFAFVASSTRSSGPTTGGRSLITAGVGVLGGAVLLQALTMLEEASRYNDQELQAGESLDFTPGLGLFLPLGALALGLVAVVLAHVGQRPRGMRVEPNTPKMGFPAPYGYQPGTQSGAYPIPKQGVPGVPRASDAPATKPEEDDDAETTQVVSSATASGQDATPTAQSDEAAAPTPPTPPAQASGTPTPPATTGPAPASQPATASPASTPQPSASSALTAPQPAVSTPPATSAPASTPAPTQASESAAQASGASAASPPASSAPASAPEPPQASESAPPASAEPASEATPPAPNQPAAPGSASENAASRPGAPTPLTDLPAAPPAPELTEDANKSDK